MRRVHVAVTLVLAASATVGLGVLLLHAEGLASFAHSSVVVIGIAVATILAVGGFFAGNLFGSSTTGSLRDRAVIKKLAEALSLERQLRIESARDGYRLRQTVADLENRLHAVRKSSLPATASSPPGPSTEPLPEPATSQQLHHIAELERLAATCERLREELRLRKERMADLQADLSVALAEADELKSRDVGMSSDISRIEFQGGSLAAILDDLVRCIGVRAALLADDQGLVIDAAAADGFKPDALAAVSCVVAGISLSVGDLLPEGEIGSVTLGDTDGGVLEIRYFPVLGSRCSLVVARDAFEGGEELVRQATIAIEERLSQ